jgi:Cys-rich protein (TIGR01571 family)
MLLLTTRSPSPSSFPEGCLAAWCPCIVYSRNRQHLRSLQYQGTPLPADRERNDDQCCIYGGLEITGYSWVMQVRSEDIDDMRLRLIRVSDQIRYREEIRERYGIRGSSLNDCCISAWCRPCALTQERREIELEERNFQ